MQPGLLSSHRAAAESWICLTDAQVQARHFHSTTRSDSRRCVPVNAQTRNMGMLDASGTGFAASDCRDTAPLREAPAQQLQLA
jgi:putative methionine-R-sulfoxide reductase with GAF domain